MAIEHGVQLASGAFANTVGPIDVMAKMYPDWNVEQPEVYLADTVTSDLVTIRGLNSHLHFEKVDDDTLASLGNTVSRNCGVTKTCAGSCALAGSGLMTTEMSELNCARANVAVVFEAVNEPNESRFMLTAVGSDTFVVGDDTKMVREMNGDELMFKKLPNASSVVFTKSWLEKQGFTEFTMGINAADGSFGLASMDILGESVLIPFCSMRDNMGDRGEDKQVVRKAINAYLDMLDLTGDARATVLENLDVRVDIGASASLRNFAHQIKIPRVDSDDPKERERAERIIKTYPDLIALAGGAITSAIVLESEYPGALLRGSIYPQAEAEMGIHISPITPGNCPGDGQSCHINYPEETKYAIIAQLKEMSISEQRISYDASLALDPASPSNNMASNRRENNNGVETENTLRTFSGMTVKLH